ncbi:MAG: hypothetical protein KatS3mg114_1017 [Planctomycetaceae bacterium]|nr:MAG: hypothetical protein KatS3mg114_1017 [Planctomycetaceae bacterium]
MAGSAATYVSSSESVGRPRPRRVMWLFVFGIVLGLGLIVRWWWNLVPPLQDLTEYQMPLNHLILVPSPPPEVPQDLVSRIQQRVGLTSYPFLDPQLVKRVAQWLQHEPWIEHVVEVRKQYPLKVVARVVYRRPIALIRTGERSHPIDRLGVVLPIEDVTGEQLSRLMIVVGVTSESPGEGKCWEDPAVQAAVELAAFLEPRWTALKLKWIHVRTGAETDETPAPVWLELETIDGSRIVWGLPPSQRTKQEISAEEKVQRLEKYLATFGSYDRPQGPYALDIRLAGEIRRWPREPARRAEVLARPNQERQHR